MSRREQLPPGAWADLKTFDWRHMAFNEVYKRYFPKNPPARIFFCVPEWTGPFDVEVDCVAVTKD